MIRILANLDDLLAKDQIRFIMRIIRGGKGQQVERIFNLDLGCFLDCLDLTFNGEEAEAITEELITTELGT